MTELGRVVAFLEEADRLKGIERMTWLGDESRRENSAEHSWHMALTAIALHAELGLDVDLGRVLQLCVVHDLVEIDAGDTYAFDPAGQATQRERELACAERLFAVLPERAAAHVRAAWDEFEAAETPEAHFAHVVDRLQGFLQNFAIGGRTWRENGITEAMSRKRNEPAFVFDPEVAELLEQVYARTSDMWGGVDGDAQAS